MKGTLPARIALFAMLAYGSPQVIAATCYVNSAATGSNNGASWANAYTDLQSALVNYPGCLQVWIARGTYKPTATTDRTISFNVSPGVLVYGGFAGTEASLALRLVAANPTILSGDIGTAGDNSDNSYHVVLMDGTTASGVILPSTLLADLTISDGNANGAGANEGIGGGLYCNGQGAGHVCNPQLTRLIFENNSAQLGGAIYSDGHSGGASSPILQDSIVRNNQAPGGGGGGMFNSGNGGTATATMERVTFTGNSADGGGAIYNNGGNSGNASPTVRNSTFYANTASQGGAMLNYAPSAGHASPVLRYVTFNHNNATSTGGAMYNFAPSGGDAAPNMSGVILWADEPNENVVNFSLTVSSIEYSIMPDCPPAAVGCIETDPLLGPLQNNGGFAPTMRPEIGSPAIDNGNATNCPADDERGTARPQAAQCDIGAVELRAAETQRCYVNGAAGPTDNGLTWATAYKTLTSGLADTNCTEVWVAQGTYKPTTGVDRNSAYYLPPGKAVYGGFAATETLRSQRNPVAHETILSGEIGAAGDASDNVYHVIVADAAASAANIGGNTVLDGFTITGGYAEGTNLQHFGGGLLCNGQGYSCNPTLSNLVFSGNHAQYGGGLANYGFGGVSSPTLKNVTFTGNSASNAGGGVYNAGSSGVSSPELSAVTFTNNTAHDNGGAMSSFGNAGISNPQVTDSTFVGNTSTFDGGAVSVKAASGSYVRVVFSGNGAGTRGGAVLVDDINGQCSPTFTSVSFVAGTAANGGAVNNALNHVGTSTATFNDVSFVNNTASQAGGAVFSNGGSTSYSDALFLGNGDVLTTQQGGAIATLGGNASVVVDRAAFVNNAAFSLGGAVWTTVDSAGGADASTQITNATFWGNEARSGSAVATRSNGAAQTATATLRSVTFAANTASFGNGTIYTDAINGGSSDSTVINAIFWGNDTAVQVYNGVNTTTTIDHAVVQGSCQSGNLCTNISLLDPLLGNLQYNSGSTPTLMPAANSPAVNFGANCPAVDQRGVARPQGVACDVGAVERRAIEDHIFSDGFDF